MELERRKSGILRRRCFHVGDSLPQSTDNWPSEAESEMEGVIKGKLGLISEILTESPGTLSSSSLVQSGIRYRNPHKKWCGILRCPGRKSLRHVIARKMFLEVLVDNYLFVHHATLSTAVLVYRKHKRQ